MTTTCLQLHRNVIQTEPPLTTRYTSEAAHFQARDELVYEAYSTPINPARSLASAFVAEKQVWF